MNLDKLKIIAKAKFSDKSNLGDWYQKRLDICKLCPYNSANKEKKSFKEKAMVVANFGKDTCIACGCGIVDKASVKELICGLKEIGLEPLWVEVGSEDVIEENGFIIKNLNPEKVTLKNEKDLEISYGNIKRHADTKIGIYLESTKDEITSVSMRSGCGCTTPIPEKTDSGYVLNIEYDSSRVGGFSKTVATTVTRNDKTITFRIIIKGHVK